MIKKQYLILSAFLLFLVLIIFLTKLDFQALVIAANPSVEKIELNSTCNEIKNAEIVFNKDELDALAESDCTKKCNSAKKDYFYWDCDEKANKASCYCN